MSDQDQDQKDTEIVLGTGKMLAIFFGLVTMCGVFFGLGYSVGHSSSPMAIQSEQSGTVVSATGTKPVAGVTLTTPPAPTNPLQTAANNPNVAANSQEEQVPPASNEAPANREGSSSEASSAAAVRTVAAAQDVAAKTTSSDDPSGPANITVQVAAVTKQEDAQALVAALRRKNYPVFVSPTPSADSLYHVQVGPFAELKDAEAMKSKLAGDGYNAIVKK
jgi:DedD protein